MTSDPQSPLPDPMFVLTTRGLEAVVASEVARIDGVAVRERGYRRVSFSAAGPLDHLLAIRTADDAFLQLATWNDLSHTRSALDDIRQRVRRFDLVRATTAIGCIRPIPEVPAFTVKSSFVGRRNYTNAEIEETVAAIVAAETGWLFETVDRAADLHIRLFAEHERVWVGVRIGRCPLHERPYPRLHRPGALKPSVAAAMVMMAGVPPGETILDPFCGTGTVLVEAVRLGHPAIGGDAATDAVAVAEQNLRAASVSGSVSRWDAASLPIADHTVQGVVTNPPWGKQVAVTESLKELYRGAIREAIRVCVPGSPVVLLTAYPELVESPGADFQARHEISLFGQTPTILILR